MNSFYKDFIKRSQKIASDKGLAWGIDVRPNGKISVENQWSLSLMSGAAPNPEVRLTFLGPDPKTVTLMEEKGIQQASDKGYWDDWFNLAKAIIVTKIYVARNKPTPIKNSLVRPLLCLLAVVGDRPPWEVTSTDVDQTYDLLCELQNSRKLAKDLRSLVKTVFDKERLSNFSPVLPLAKASDKRQRLTTADVRRRLSERKHGSKLPEEQAFWEMARIVWEENPRSYFDKIRFAIVRVLIICGLRVSEAITIPADWKRKHQYFEPNEKIPQEAFRESLVLRFFAAKQRAQRQDTVSLHDAIQHIPDLFEDALSKTLEDILLVTAPLRDRLRLQCQTGRLFPEFDPDELVHVFEMYPRLTGEPFIFEDCRQENLTKEWNDSYDVEILEEIERRQKHLRIHSGKLRNKVRQFLGSRLTYFDKKTGQEIKVPVRDCFGTPFAGNIKYPEAYLKIRDVEDLYVKGRGTKVSDTTRLNLSDGSTLLPSELLFLIPKRALGEERNGMVCDVRKFAFIGVLDIGDIINAMGEYEGGGTQSIFKKYGKSSNEKKYRIKTHDFRHLQNTELFRLGIADTVITKRYSRNSVQQSYEYDHRSLAEELASMEVPEDAQPYLLGKSSEVYKMIASGMATGPVVEEFKAIQRNEGDVAAYTYLSVEADGLHTTPYGHCINSFTVDPCPKHLECFNGCIHLTRSPLTEHTKNLKETLERLKKVLKSIDGHPAPSGAKQKMKEQAESRITAIETMLATPVGQKVFPSGGDLSVPIKETFSGAFNDS